MSTATPFLVDAPAERTTPWRVVVDGQRSGGMFFAEVSDYIASTGVAHRANRQPAGAGQLTNL